MGFLGKGSLVFNFCPRKGLFSAIGVRRTPSQRAALGLAANTAEATRVEATGQWGSCADVRRSPRQEGVLALAVKAHDGRGTPRARAPGRGDHAENGSGNGNRDDGPVGALRGALAGESETAGGAMN